MNKVKQQPALEGRYKYKFSEDWFSKMIPIWESMFNAFPKVENILEIGCYEGRATVWLCENIFNDSSKTYNYDVIDTFGGSLEETGMKHVEDKLDKENRTKLTAFFELC